MKFRLITSITLSLSLVVPLAGTTALAADPSAPPDAAPQVWLKGAFGRVLGDDPARPAGSAPDGAALDTWIREAPLILEADVPFEDLLELRISARPPDGEAPAQQLSGGATMFAGPDGIGLSVITAAITTNPYGTSEHAWLVDVPDREGGEEALLDIPGLSAELVSNAGSVSGEPGSGCYLYLCVDVGAPPPAGFLEALPVAVGETPTLRLGDGSAMVGWKGTLQPLGYTRADTVEAEAAFRDVPAAVPELAGLEPTVAGEWLLDLRADFDRERGWQRFAYRIVSE